MKVGEMMQEDKEHIWFVTRANDTLDEKTKVDRYIITKNGNMQIYVAEKNSCTNTWKTSGKR
ncbi:hypothetical protein [Staphylococcus pseudintermedius]